ncbi:unnamed protein product [Wuchereria bancrofti]|uniref:Uncharacterized protein n=1 Tax=Wuchereria bancrofti TaxID=6293 RepID=A0A3P7FDI1_WUCBA|nr:unnamed protein product [Wuchereria bancrofti]
MSKESFSTMSERYQRWLQIFKQLNKNSPTKEDIELIAPSHIKGNYVNKEYLKLHPPRKVVSKPIPKVKLKRSFDERDCLPEITLPDDLKGYQGLQPVLKKHRADVIITSRSETIFQTKDSPLLRRSPRKHPSSLIRPTASKKINSPSRSVARRSLTNLLESETFQNIDRSSANFVVPESEPPAHIAQSLNILRRSPRKHPSSYNEVLLSPQKPLLLSQPIICRRLSSLLGSVSDIENEKESTSLNSSFEPINEDENKKNPEENSQELINIGAEEEQQPFLDEKECLKKKIRGKNENYRRLKMKKSYVRGTSLAKKNFRKWRSTRNKR